MSTPVKIFFMDRHFNFSPSDAHSIQPFLMEVESLIIAGCSSVFKKGKKDLNKKRVDSFRK